MARALPPARIRHTISNVTTGENWALIEVRPQTFDLAVPARQAQTVVALINDAHRHLATALDKYIAGDPEWRRHISRVALATDELQRMGRPKVSKEEMVRYAQTHGMDAAARRYNITVGTLDRYRRQVDRDGQK